MIFNSECTRNHLSAELCPDPLENFTALPRPPSWIRTGDDETRNGYKSKGAIGKRRKRRRMGKREGKE